MRHTDQIQLPPGPFASLIFCLNKSISKFSCVCAQSCPTTCDSKDYSPPGSFIHLTSQARILEWVAISFSQGFSQPKNWIHICIGRQILYFWATKEGAKNPTLFPNHAYQKRSSLLTLLSLEASFRYPLFFQKTIHRSILSYFLHLFF